jgi:integrase
VSKKDVVTDWLSEFKGKNTRNVYRSVLRKFQKFVGLDLNEYIAESRDFLGDFKAFVASLDTPPKSATLYTSVVKLFLQEQKFLKLSEDEWRKIKKRQEIVDVPVTQDRAPTKSELKQILNYLDIKGRALVLFLASTGARIGETLQIRTDDVDLDSDPPKAAIRALATKGNLGGRVVRMSYEARDAIRDWMKIKGALKNKTGASFDKELVFSFSSTDARNMWNRAIKKAKLDQRDPETNRYVLHFHSLRKFFRTNIGLDFDLTNALMVHYAYLDKSARTNPILSGFSLSEYKAANKR